MAGAEERKFNAEEKKLSEAERQKRLNEIEEGKFALWALKAIERRKLELAEAKQKTLNAQKNSENKPKLRFDLSKNLLLNENTSWFSVRNYLNEYIVYVHIDNKFADEVVESVFLGINTSTPDKEIKIDYTKPKIELRFKDVQYVSSYLSFKDGTISETRTQKANK